MKSKENKEFILAMAIGVLVGCIAIVIEVLIHTHTHKWNIREIGKSGRRTLLPFYMGLSVRCFGYIYMLAWVLSSMYNCCSCVEIWKFWRAATSIRLETDKQVYGLLLFYHQNHWWWCPNTIDHHHSIKINS